MIFDYINKTLLLFLQIPLFPEHLMKISFTVVLCLPWELLLNYFTVKCLQTRPNSLCFSLYFMGPWLFCFPLIIVSSSFTLLLLNGPGWLSVSVPSSRRILLKVTISQHQSPSWFLDSVSLVSFCKKLESE